MSRPLSPAALQAMLAEQTDEVPLMCVTISHSSFASPYYLVYNNEPLQRAIAEFEPFAFQLALAPESEDALPQVQMTIDNIDRKILQAIRTLPAGERVSMTMEVVLASQPDVVEVGPVNYKFLSIDFDQAQITGTLGFDDDLLNTTLGQTYTPVNSPGVFA